jgi:flagellar hook assembly protein FlgD
LNEFYETDLDTYKSGEIRYQLPELTEGNHTLKLQAWDVHNNSSSATIDFVVAEDSEIALDHVLNYPNPFTTHTEFMFEHNQVCTTLDVLIQIFTVSGKLVKTIEHQALQNGFRSESIPWDGTDDFGDRIGKGVYVYRMEVRNENGQSAEHIEKLVILK